MTSQPEALRLAEHLDAVDKHVLKSGTLKPCADLLRTQHAALERKDALLRQAVNMVSQCIRYDFDDEPLDEFDVHAKDLCNAITSEIAK